MAHISPSLENVISSPGKNSDFLRFCLSDRISSKLDLVVETDISPVEYSLTTLDKNYKLLRERFFEEDLIKKNVPEAFVKEWIFDRLLLAALLFRNGHIRTVDEAHVDEIMSKTGPFLLLVDSNDGDLNYSGLADFSCLVDTFIEFNKDNLIYKDTSLLTQLGQCVSHIRNSDWLFYQKDWRNAYLNKSVRLQNLRRFLHAVITSYVIPDDQISDICMVDRHTLFGLAQDFISLVNNNASKDDIVKFSKNLHVYFENFPVNQFFAIMFSAPFRSYHHVHFSNFGDRFNPTPISA